MAKKIKDLDGKVYVQKTPFYKKWWFIGIVVLMIIGYLKGGSTSEQSTISQPEIKESRQSADVVTETVKEEAKEAAKEIVEEVVETKTYHIGELVTVGDVSYIVNSKELATNVGGDFGKTANGVYLILDITVTNNDKKAITVTDDFFKLLKGDVQYEADTSAGIYANVDAKFFLTELNPEGSVTGKVVFDLTEETANDPNLQLQVQTGFWGTQKELISLN
ncbi:DUF4352 domain-containing protein [Streptococcus fryi]